MHRTRYSPSPEPEDEPPAGDLTRSGQLIVQAARFTLSRAIEEMAPPGANKLALAVTAIAGLFGDTVCRMSNSADICAVINQQLRTAGYELVPVRRN